MKWILVVLVGGVTPVQTNLQFDKLSDCLNGATAHYVCHRL